MTEQNKRYQIFANIILGLISVCVLIPFVLLVSSSFTAEEELIRSGYGFIPKKIDFTAYKVLLVDSNSILKAYMVSFAVTGTGTVINLILTTLMAYPLSRKDLPGRSFFAFFLFFTMLFNGGLVSSYIMWTQTFHIKNTIWALIVPNLMMSGFYIIMMRTYFTTNVPDEVMEAARIDGAGELTVLLRVVLPMAVPIIATLGLLVGLNYWNDWLNGLYYVSDDKYYSIQVLLNKMLLNTEAIKRAAATGVFAGKIPSVGLKMAVAVLGSLPLIIVYPFFQRYIVKGITVGAVKG